MVFPITYYNTLSTETQKILQHHQECIDDITITKKDINEITKTYVNEHFLIKQIEELKREPSIITQIESLQKLYIFKNPREIRNFLLQDITLIEHLLDGYLAIMKVFQTGEKLELEYVIDAEENWDALTIIIPSHLPIKQIIRLERELFENWFVYIIDQVGNKLNYITKPL